jgi:carboxypeptidase T
MLLSTLLSLPFLASPMLPPQAPRPEAVHLVRVELTGAGHTASDLAAIGLDVVRVDPGRQSDSGLAQPTVQVVVDDDELALLKVGSWSAEVLIEDLAHYYADRLENGPHSTAPANHGSWLSPPFASGGMGGYYTYSEIVSVLDQISSAYPSLVTTRVSLGQSHQGRDLWMVKVSDNPGLDEGEPEVRIDALHHAREPESMQASLWFLLWLVEEYGVDPAATYLVDEREIFFVLCVNPDGYVYNEQIAPNGGGMWRKNRRDNGGGEWGVDLNRNYPYKWGYNDSGSSPNPSSGTYRGPSAGSEPATQAMVAFIGARDFQTALSIHTYSDVWLSPLGYIPDYPANWSEYEEVGDLATEVNGYPHGPIAIILYDANGGTIDFDHGTEGTMAWTPEIGGDSDGFWPPQSRIVPLAEENLLALTRTALAGGAWVRSAEITATDAGDGDGSYEAGENVDVTVSLRNSGRLASLPVDLTLTTTSPYAEILVGNTSAGALAPFSDGSGGTPLVLRILPGTPSGESILLVVTATSGSWVDVLETEILVGTEVVVASFDFEAGGDEGWSVGAPNDASTGTWTRVDPRGTEAQPEDDHTAGGSNTHCWVTGQGSVGGSLGENDVDSGSTSLWSPVFDLSSATNPRVTYWRWYSNDKGSAPDTDIFTVEISDDGGSSWVTAETVGPTGAESNGGWYEAVLELDSIPGLNLTTQNRLRFIASDLGDGSIVEAALDDLLVSYIGDGDCPPPTSYCTTSPNSAGSGALMSWAGSTGIGDNDFTLLTTDGPPDQFALFIFGVNENANPLGDGTLCIGAPQQRLGVVLIDGVGQATRLVDFTVPPAAGQFVSGSTWNFQLWYRDPSFGSFGFNLSDGLKVTFCD